VNSSCNHPTKNKRIRIIGKNKAVKRITKAIIVEIGFFFMNWIRVILLLDIIIHILVIVIKNKKSTTNPKVSSAINYL
jgi:hypothetical protein